MSTVFRLIFVVLLALNLSGCLTIDRLIRFTEEPQVYGGTRSHIYPSMEDYNREFSFGSDLGFADPVVRPVVWGIDLPFSFVADTLLLPVTIPYELLAERDEPGPWVATNAATPGRNDD